MGEKQGEKQKYPKFGTFYWMHGDIRLVAFGTIWFYNNQNKLSHSGNVESGVSPLVGHGILMRHIIEAADVCPAAFNLLARTDNHLC
jgi:hypothetical protein